MGADYDFFIINKQSKRDVIAEFESMKRSRQYENGHGGYTGTIAETPGIEIHKGLYTLKAAKEYIYKNAQKWENAIAVLVLDNNKMYWYCGALCSC